jgi:uracil-DNA glycosylase
VVHGPAVMSRVLLIGQAPGPHEGALGRPFAWTAGKTLFRWFEQTMGISEEQFRRTIYMAAVARCFPGKAPGGGDRRPDSEETARCRPFLEGEVSILKPRLVIPVGGLAIEQVLGRKAPLALVVGKQEPHMYCGVRSDIICLPHPSGASTWHKMEPGIGLLAKALRLIKAHPEVKLLCSR